MASNVRARLATSQRELHDLADMCVNIEKMDVELREIAEPNLHFN